MEVTKDEIVALFHRHLVPLCIVFTTENKGAVYVATAFVLSAEGEWLLVTAGHVASDIKDYLENPQYCLVNAFLYDYGGLGAIHYEPIPFELTTDNLLIFGDDTTLDYAVIHLRPHYKNLLIVNNIEPLNEETWLKHPQNPEYFMMLGVPREMVSVEWNNDAKSAINQVNVATAFLPIEHVEQGPDGLAIRSFDRWYGYVTVTTPLDDISGKSGAPVFAFQHTVNGEWRYWLIGVQSSWNRGNKAIAVCPAQILGNCLAKEVKKFKEWQANQANAADAKNRAAD